MASPTIAISSLIEQDPQLAEKARKLAILPGGWKRRKP
jgi:hypothetical protein